MIIRNIKEEDIPEYIRWVNQVWNETYRGIVDDSFLDNMENTTEYRIKRQKEKYKNNELNTVYVMLDDDRLIGYTSINHSRDEEKNDSGDISSLYLLKEYQGKGLGTKLYNYSLNKLILKGYRDYIISCLDKNETNEFYKKKGGKLYNYKYRKIGDKEYKENFYYFEV